MYHLLDVLEDDDPGGGFDEIPEAHFLEVLVAGGLLVDDDLADPVFDGK